MRTRVKQHWFGSEMYLQISYRPRTHQMEVRLFVVDPRKAQHHKVKYWNRGFWIPFQDANGVMNMVMTGLGYGRFRKPAQKIFEELGLTSSVGRAAA